MHTKYTDCPVTVTILGFSVCLSGMSRNCYHQAWYSAFFYSASIVTGAYCLRKEFVALTFPIYGYFSSLRRSFHESVSRNFPCLGGLKTLFSFLVNFNDELPVNEVSRSIGSSCRLLLEYLRDESCWLWVRLLTRLYYPERSHRACQRLVDLRVESHVIYLHFELFLWSDIIATENLSSWVSLTSFVQLNLVAPNLSSSLWFSVFLTSLYPARILHVGLTTDFWE